MLHSEEMVTDDGKDVFREMLRNFIARLRVWLSHMYMMAAFALTLYRREYIGDNEINDALVCRRPRACNKELLTTEMKSRHRIKKLEVSNGKASLNVNVEPRV